MHMPDVGYSPDPMRSVPFNFSTTSKSSASMQCQRSELKNSFCSVSSKCKPAKLFLNYRNMYKHIAAFLLSTCAVASALSVDAAESTYTTYQMKFRDVAVSEARAVIDRAI